MEAAKHGRLNSRKPALDVYGYSRNALRFDGGDHRFQFGFRGWNTLAPRCTALGQFLPNQRFDTIRLTERAVNQAGSGKRKCTHMPYGHATGRFTAAVNESDNRGSMPSPHNHCGSLAGLFHYVL